MGTFDINWSRFAKISFVGTVLFGFVFMLFEVKGYLGACVWALFMTQNFFHHRSEMMTAQALVITGKEIEDTQKMVFLVHEKLERVEETVKNEAA